MVPPRYKGRFTKHPRDSMGKFVPVQELQQEEKVPHENSADHEEEVAAAETGNPPEAPQDPSNSAAGSVISGAGQTPPSPPPLETMPLVPINELIEVILEWGKKLREWEELHGAERNHEETQSSDDE